jgi:hypothetical protein
MPIVQMPDGTNVSFPDNMPTDQIKGLIAKKFPSDVASHLSNVAQGLSSGMSWSGAAEDAVKNIPSSAVSLAENTAQPFIHPVETAENLGALGKGVLQKLGLMSGTDSEKYANAVGQFVMNRYGSLEAVKHTLATDPVGMMADVSTLLTGGGSAAARLPGVAGKLGEAAGAVGRAVDPLNAVAATARGAGKVAAQAAGISTGVGADALKVAAQAGAQGGPAGKAFLENMTGAADPNAVVSEAKAAVGQIRQERGAVYQQEMAKIGADNTVLDFDKIDSAVQKVAGVKTYKGQVLSPKTATIRQELTDAVNEWKNLPAADFHTAEGLDALKQKIGDIRDATQPGTPDRLVADNVYKAVYSTIADQAPKYAKVMKGYEEASNLIREMEKTLSLNPKASIDTSLRKLTSVLRNNVSTNYGRRAELVDFLQRAGAPHLMQKLAGQMLSSAAPRGLARNIAAGEIPGAALAATLGHPAGAAALIGGMAASSPMLAGGAAYGLGAASRLPLRQAGRAAFQIGRLPGQ